MEGVSALSKEFSRQGGQSASKAKASASLSFLSDPHHPISPSSTAHKTHIMQDWQPGQRYETGQQLKFGNQQFVVQQPHTSRSSLCPFPISPPSPVLPPRFPTFPRTSLYQKHVLRLTDSRSFFVRSAWKDRGRLDARPNARSLRQDAGWLARTVPGSGAAAAAGKEGEARVGLEQRRGGV